MNELILNIGAAILAGIAALGGGALAGRVSRKESNLTVENNGGSVSLAQFDTEAIISHLQRAMNAKDPERLNAIENLIGNYHEQALNQARAQFWFSVFAATVGFFWIVASGLTIDPEKLGTIFKALPGVVMDTVAFLFFKQAAETRQRATELYDRLRNDKNIATAIEVANSIEDIQVRSTVKAQLVLHVAGLPVRVEPPLQEKTVQPKQIEGKSSTLEEKK